MKLNFTLGDFYPEITRNLHCN